MNYYNADGQKLFEVFDSFGVLNAHSYFWEPDVQEASVYKPWDYPELIAQWDALGFEKITYSETACDGNGLYHYVYNPANASRTILLQAGVHGNEMDAKQQLLKIARMMAEGIGTWKYVRNLAKWIFVPCISPYGHETSSMNVPYSGVSTGINLNRNYDFLHQYALDSAGVGGSAPWEYAEVRHIKWIVEQYKPDYAIDFHDGGDVKQHLWLSYSADAPNQRIVDDLITHLIEKWKIENPVIDHCGDNKNSTGVAAMYFSKTLGIPASVCEWIGGYLGYTFDSDQMTKSLTIRGNMIRMAAYSDFSDATTPKKVNGYWRWEYAPSATCQGLRPTNGAYTCDMSEIYLKWRELGGTESASYGRNTTDEYDVSTFTFGTGPKKILYMGGCMRWSGLWQHTMDAIWLLIQAAQNGKFGTLLTDYTFVVCPGIDLTGANNNIERYCGLNNEALNYGKWKNGAVSYGSNIKDSSLVKDVPLFQAILADHTDAVTILSGGERLEGYAGNDTTKYSTDCLNHIAVPDGYTGTPLPEYPETIVVEQTGGGTFGDYVMQNYHIPVFYVDRRPDEAVLATRNTDIALENYQYCNREMAQTICLLANLLP